MDLKLTEEQQMMKKTFADFSAKEIAPVAEEIDEKGFFPKEVVKKMAELDIFGILLPPHFCGLGRQRIDLLLAAEEIAKYSPAVEARLAITNAAYFVMLAFRKEDQTRH